MEIKRTTEIFVETRRRFVVSQPETEAAEKFFCPRCGGGETAAMVPIEAAAALFEETQRGVYQLVEAEAAHFAETPAGALLVCLDSLAQHLARRANEIGGEK